MAQVKPWERNYGNASPGVVIRDPYADDEQRRAEETQRIQREQLRIAQDREARAAADAAREADKEAAEQATEAEEQARLSVAQARELDDTISGMRNVIEKARQAKNLSNEWFATGFMSDYMAGIGGSSATDVRALLDPIAANTAFDRLQRMREASPTGGALGAVSERELRLLQSTISSLDANQSDVQFQQSMDQVIRSYQRVVAKLESARAYERENGSMIGYVPPTDDEIANIGTVNEAAPRALDPLTPEPAEPQGSATVGGGLEPSVVQRRDDPLRAAGEGATEASIPVPPEMQEKYLGYIARNWGNLDPRGLEEFVGALELEYGRPVGVPDYRDFVDRANAAAAEGLPASVVGPIPATNRELSQFEQIHNNIAANPWGTGIISAADGFSFGAVSALSGDRVDMAKELNPTAGFAGDMLGSTAGAVATGGLLGTVARGGGLGSNIIRNPLTADGVHGAIYGYNASDGEGTDAVIDGLIGGGTAVVGGKVGEKIGGALPAITGVRMPSDPFRPSERAVVDSFVQNPDEVVEALAEADRLGVPMTLADASPEMNSLAGSAVRYSPSTAGTAREVMAQRNQGQLDRLAEAVEGNLGPVTNIPQRSADLMAEARAKAGPLYDQAYAAPGADGVQLDDLMQRPSFAPALKQAYRIAQEEGVDPGIYGFVMDELGEVSIDPSRLGGRFDRAAVDSELNYLTNYTIPTYGGGEVSKRGPLDLVGWLRTRGGLQDSGDELAHMGLTNKPRGASAMLSGREAEFGPLVNSQDGMNFDDAALAAWEAGYFPEFAERPDINTFLNAVRDTAEGIDQRFLPEDMGEVERFLAAREGADAVRRANGEGGGMWSDNSIPSGPRDPAPLEAYGEVAPVGLSYEALDQVKRGLDAIIENETDAVTGKVSRYGMSVIDTKNTLLSRMDEANPAYREARRAYAGPAQEREYLQQGVDAVRTRPDQLGVDIADLTPEQLGQMRLGFQSETMGQAGNLRNNSNPWAQLNTPNTEGRLATLYGDDANIADLLAQRDLELRLAGNANRLVGNSMTAEREVADAFFGQTASQGSSNLPLAIAETAMTGGPFLTVGKSIGDRLLRNRREAAAAEANRSLADELGPMMLQNNPAEIDAMISDLLANNGDYLTELLDKQARAKMRGAYGGAGVTAALNSEYRY